MDEIQLIEAIRMAFAQVGPGEITLHEAEAIDSYADTEERNQARRLNRETSWWEVPDGEIEACPNALPHLDPAGWRFYIAAYMTWALRNFRHSDSIVTCNTIYSFDLHPDGDLVKYKLARFTTLSEQQIQVVCSFLRFMAQNGDLADDTVAKEALDTYWGPFCESPSV